MNLTRTFTRNCSFGSLQKSKVPVITVPKYLEAAIKKHEKNVRNEMDGMLKEREMRGDRSVPVIVSRGGDQKSVHRGGQKLIRRGDQKLVHYLGQKYEIDRRSREPKVPLFSLGWGRGIKHQNEEIIFRAYEERDRSPSLSDEVVRFDQLPLDKNIIATLNQEGYIEPTHVQVKGIGEILRSRNVIISSEGGSGKTLAYGIPLVHSVMRYKNSGRREEREDPLAMVIVPSRELAEQIGRILTKLAQVVGVGVATMIGGAPKHISHSGYDIIVTTPGLVHRHMRER